MRSGGYADAYISTSRKYGLPEMVKRAMKELKPRRDAFKVIVVSGLSGVIPGAIVANRLGKQLVVVRKDDDHCHGERLEGRAGFNIGDPYIVLDDFIARGGTMRRIYGALLSRGYQMPLYTMLYDGSYYRVPMVVPADVLEPHTQWYVQANPVAGTEHLYLPYASRDAAGKFPDNNLWRTDGR